MSEQYERAIEQMEQHIERNADGTFNLKTMNGRDIGIDDPVVFSDLKRSLDVTNKMIRDGQIKPEDIKPFSGADIPSMPKTLEEKRNMEEKWQQVVRRGVAPSPG